MLLGALIIAATVAVVAVLVGNINDVMWRAIGTLFSAIVHIVLLFGVVSIAAPGANESNARSTNLVINASMVIAILSFFTSMFGIWGVIDGDIAFKLYTTYIVILFLLIHAKTLMDVEATYAKVRPYVLANYAVMALVAVLILGVVYIPDGFDLLSSFYGRLLAAAAIIDVTLSIIVTAMHRLYVQKNPLVQAEGTPAQKTSGIRIIAVILFFVFVVWPLFSLMASMIRP